MLLNKVNHMITHLFYLQHKIKDQLINLYVELTIDYRFLPSRYTTLSARSFLAERQTVHRSLQNYTVLLLTALLPPL